MRIREALGLLRPIAGFPLALMHATRLYGPRMGLLIALQSQRQKFERRRRWPSLASAPLDEAAIHALRYSGIAGPLDPPELMAMLDSFQGIVAFDVGANAGLVTRRLLKRFIRVYAFEPNPQSFRLLSTIKTRRLSAYNIALSDFVGELDMEIREMPSLSGQYVRPSKSLDIYGWGKSIKTVKVPCTTIDAFCAQNDVSIVDFIKIDVEGFEDSVIRGAMSTIRRCKPLLYIEIHSKENYDYISQELNRCGYRQIIIRHPHYPKGSSEYKNHFWLIGT
jgi:FkbM family methyltransferase